MITIVPFLLLLLSQCSAKSQADAAKNQPSGRLIRGAGAGGAGAGSGGGGDSSGGNGACFSGYETLLLESGTTVQMSEAQIGERVQVMDALGRLTFSEISFLPHKRNDVAAKFVHLETTARSIRTTPSHLIMAGQCDSILELTRAEDVEVGACVSTVEGQEEVIDSSITESAGIYTVVTQETSGLIVVNGVVASSFAVNHWVPNTFYNFHRLAHQILPTWVMKSSTAVEANLALGELIGSVL